MKLEGAITAMVTPFTEEGVDIEGLKKNIKHQLSNGISGLVPLGTTGESPTVSEAEREEIIKTVVAEVKKKVPVIVGVGTNSTEKTIKNAKQAKELGADALLVVSPYYNKPSQEGLYRHFIAVAEAVDLPIVVYNIQGRTAVNIETATLKRMAEHENIVAVKEASGNPNQMMDVIKQIPGLTVLSGDDSVTLPLMAMGGKGVISVCSNLLPKEMSELCKACLKGDYAKAKDLHYKLLPMFRAEFVETNPVPMKAAMGMAGLAAGPVRPPLCPMQPESLEKLKAAMKLVGL
ncbi:4-hydroxy-tetrahydrodipicolinate synthase [Candidatus Woesearchaeota archaeon]|nr:4-hydroxy-tetrahydrodipicolinate synthase [Candidatus Woesearchaeota archaeon]